MKESYKWLCSLAILIFVSCSQPSTSIQISSSTVGLGWAKTSVNAPIFRKNSIVSANGFQFVAYYDSVANVVLAKRNLNDTIWTRHTTQYNGNVYDAHNVICIMLDGNGYLHMSWDHHNNALNYSKSVKPFELEMGDKIEMTGTNEAVLSYPEFYKFTNGDLLFAYRDGGSGKGNLVLNSYSIKTKKWERVHTNLIDGEGQRNAYWQIFVDNSDKIYVSWVWRESPDVASNHDMCYAESTDKGKTWSKSNGDTYILPITQQSAEVIFPIPQNSNLINQTSMTSDLGGNVYIATYYKNELNSCTQFHLIYNENKEWKHSTISNRSSDFNLSGMGSRSIPISRPQIVVEQTGEEKQIHVIYRDEAFDNKVCISSANSNEMDWKTQVVSSNS
ncbi:MAG: BNR repeat-containing protein, partial [Prolixibacteraceae bacterium]|nr:BNR repeat-containing protein [Prolixibacteraceae bacterium]